MAPSFKGLNNGHELSIIGFVLSLYGDHFLREKGYQVPLANFGLREIRIWIFMDHVTGKMLIQMI